MVTRRIEAWFKLRPSELRDLSIVILVLAFCFSFKWEGPQTLSAWFGNFLSMLMLVLIAIAVHEIAHRKVADFYSARVYSKIWFWGVAAALILVFLTSGRFIFAALWAVVISSVHLYRPGKPRKAEYVGPYNRAKIAASGPLANLGLAIVAKALIPVFGSIAATFMTINLWIAVLNLFPFFTLLPILASVATRHAISYKLVKTDAPYVEGEFLFFGSRLLWVFTFTFVLITGIGLVYTGILASLIIAALTSIGIWFVWHYYIEGAKPQP